MTEHASRRWRERLLWAVVAIALLAVGYASWSANRAANKQDVLDIVSSYYADTRQDVTSLCDDEANKDKPECLSKPPPPSKVVGEAGGIGPQGPGPSVSQVRDAVSSLLPLFVGPGITDFCRDGRCVGSRGLAGRDGADGAPGADSNVPGPKGDTGPAGESVKGDQGVGLDHVECNDADEFVMVYTDGHEQNVTGSRCRAPRLPGDP